MKGQVLADFIAETPIPSPPPEKTRENEKDNKRMWTLYTDGTSSKKWSGAGMVLISPEGSELTYSLKFEFKSTNNEAEYEALIAGTWITRRLGVQEILIKVDSALVANQINGEYVTKDEGLVKYKTMALRILAEFKTWQIIQIPRMENEKADAASKTASTGIQNRQNKVLIEWRRKESLG